MLSFTNAQSLFFPVILYSLFLSSQVRAQGNGPTAEQIIQRSITNSGGIEKLESMPVIETISRTITAKNDTVSIAIKKSEPGLYYKSILGRNHKKHTTLFNQGSAMMLAGDSALPVTDPLQLEELRLQSYPVLDYGYKKLGYRFERLEDQHFTNTDLYQLKVTSPLGSSTLNYYEKRTGNLTMIAYANGNKTIITDHHKKNGITYPSELMLVDTMNNLTRSSITSINVQDTIDNNWFLLPAAGIVRTPDALRTGKFVYVGGNEGAVIRRDVTRQVEESSDSRIEYKVKWETANSYLLYDLLDPSSMPVTANISNIIVKITAWQGNRYYCHFVTSGNDAGTCVFEKVD